MLKIKRLAWIILCLFVMPTAAQDEAQIDIYGDYTETYTIDNITFHYPEGMVISHENHQITLRFGDNYGDTMMIVLPAMFDYFGIANHTPEIALRTIYRTVYRVSRYDTRPPRFSMIAQPTQFAGLDAMTFALARYIAYTFEGQGGVYAAILLTNDYNYVRELELYILERVVGSMLVDGEPISPNFVALPYPNADILSRPLPEPLPADSLTLYGVQIGDFILQYPTGWVSQYDSSSFIIASSQQLLDGYLRLRSWRQVYNLELDDDDVILIFESTTLNNRPASVIANNYLTQRFNFKVASVSRYANLPMERYYVHVRHYNLARESFYLIAQLDAENRQSTTVFGMAGDYDEAEPIIFAILDSITMQ